MTLHRRLLMAGGGTGSFLPPVLTFTLGATGFWNAMSSPRAQYYNGKTYLAWTNDAGDIYAAAWDHGTETLSTPYLLLAGQIAVDGAIHVSPAILVRPSDHKIVVANVANGGTHRPAIWISLNPEDATSFDAGADIGTAGVYTYTDLVLLGTDIYLITAYWNTTRRLAWYVSSDGGATWGSLVEVMRPAVNSTFFWRVASNGSRIDIYSTDTDRTAAPSSVYHSYWDGSTLRNSAGVSLGTLSAFSDDGTLVQDDSGGQAYACGATYSGGEPCAVLWTDQTTDTTTLVARWTGAAWQVDEVASAGGIIGGNPNVAAAAIGDLDPDTVYMPVKVGPHFELYRYTSPDGGTTWDGEALTSGSSFDYASPECPLDADPALRVIVGFGTYVDDFDFLFTAYGYGS